MRRCRGIALLLFLCCLALSSQAQELYPNTEPASTMPKGALGIRAMTENFKEYDRWRNQFTLRAMYGLGARLSVYVQSGFSNHHDTILPRDLVHHTHDGGSTIYTSNAKAFGLDYPYLSGGVYGYAKYRFYTKDAQQQHLRMAVYAEGSSTNTAHDEAEPGLQGDTKGWGAGLIVTQLKHRFAATLTGGVVFAGTYHDSRTDYSHSPPEVLNTYITYGRAYNYNLSMGYLLYPSVYRGYRQLNFNVYMELLGRSYDGADVVQNGNPVEVQTATLKGSHYVDALPGIQLIVNSNTRIDLSAAFSIVNRSYRHFYPVFMTGIQHYFYFR